MQALFVAKKPVHPLAPSRYHMTLLNPLVLPQNLPAIRRQHRKPWTKDINRELLTKKKPELNLF